MPTLSVSHVLTVSEAKLSPRPPRMLSQWPHFAAPLFRMPGSAGRTHSPTPGANPCFIRDSVGIGRCLALLVASLAWTSAVQAQESPDVGAPAHVAYLVGTVTLERDGALDSASVNMPIVAGDRLRTSMGRVELLFPDGSALDLDENSSLDVLSPTLVRLAAGRAMMMVAGASDPSAAVRYQIDTPVASVRTDGPGEFRVAVLISRDGETELAVVRGLASLATERSEIAVRAGQRTVASENGAPSVPQSFNSARFDEFDRWVAERRDDRMAASSARYLPRELQTYGGTLDRYGSWQQTAPYGYVWYPNVSADWRPYYDGSWSPIPSYGWTWIGADPWSWPTHHYGRWGHAGARWFWIPGRTWGPAWVSWAAAPGYVSWCPLGFDGRPVFALSIGGSNSWAGWTVVPRGSFGFRNARVNRYAIQPHLLPRSTPFIVQSVAPVAVPRRAEARVNEGGDRRRASPDLGRRARTNESGPPGDRRQTAADRGAGIGERAVPRPSSGDPRSPAPNAGAAPRFRDDRVFSPGRRLEADSPASTRGFRQPLPDGGRARPVERATPTSRPGRVEETAPRDAGPSRDPRRFSAGAPRANDDRPIAPPTTPNARRAPEAAAPRYGRPGVERQTPSAPPSPRPIERPVERAPRPPDDRRATPRGAPASAPPAGGGERSAGRAESHGERAVPRGDGRRR
jgi:Family of unknown function (DUF6600)/FecR protein